MFFEEELITITDTEKLSKFLSIFGIIPWYDFKENRLARPKIFKCYVTILALGLTALCIHLMHLRCQMMYISFSVFLFFDITLEVVALSLTLVTILGTAYYNMNSWVKLFKSDGLVDASEEFPNKIVDEVIILKYRKVVFGLGNAFILIIHHFNRTVLEEAGHVGDYYTSTFILTYYQFLIGFTILYTTAFIKAKCIFINKLFKECQPGDVDFLKNVQKVKRFCFKIDDTVEHYNTVFGWPLLMLFLVFLLTMVGSSMGAVTKHFAWMNNLYHVTNKGILVNVAYVFQSVVWLTAIIFCCDSVVSEADELLLNCQKLEETLPPHSKEHEVLENLRKLVYNKSPKLTAAGFFEIRRSTLLSLLSTTTTYFIVALQFNSLK